MLSDVLRRGSDKLRTQQIAGYLLVNLSQMPHRRWARILRLPNQWIPRIRMQVPENKQEVNASALFRHKRTLRITQRKQPGTCTCTQLWLNPQASSHISVAHPSRKRDSHRNSITYRISRPLQTTQLHISQWTGRTTS